MFELDKSWLMQISQSSSAPTRLYDSAKVRMEKFGGTRFGPVHPVVVDEFGRSILAVNAYLVQLRIDGAPFQTIKRYAYILADIFGILHATGIDLSGLSDRWLELLKAHLTGPAQINGRETGDREIAGRTFDDYLSCLLQLCLYSERHGWSDGLIGEGLGFRITIDLRGRSIGHPLRNRGAKSGTVILPRGEVFTLIESEIGRGRKNLILKKRDRIRILMQRKGGLRRSEVLRIGCDAIASREWIEHRKGRGDYTPVAVNVVAAKTNHTKTVFYSLVDIDEIRNFIDCDRPKQRPHIDAHEIFISSKTRRALVPQSTTNQFGTAAHAAARAALHHPEFQSENVDISKTRQHMYRHRKATDQVKYELASGRKPLETLLTLMADLGLKTLDTALIYLHYAVDEFRSGSAAEIALAENLKKEIDEASETAALLNMRVRRRR